MSNGRLNQVLLVGEAGARLEVDLVPYGLACVSVSNANDAVARLKTTPFSFVVVTAALPDMSGPAFVDGLLRHFDPSTVVLLGDVDPAQAAQLQRSPKVAFFPGNVDGADVADFLFQRVGGLSPPLATAPSTPPQPTFPGPGTARGMFGELPRQPTASSFAPPTGSLPPTQNPWPGTSGTPAQPRPAQNGAAPFFAAFSAQPGTGAAAPMPPSSSSSSPPMSSGPDRATMERIEQMATEVAQANAEVITLRARLGAAEASSRDSAERLIVAEQRAARAEQEASSLRSEVDAARRSAIHQVAEVMALSDEGEPISAELDDLKSKVDMAESERDSAASQLNMVRAERDRLTSDLSAAQQALQERALEADGLRRQLQDGLGEIERARADAESMRHLLSDLEGRSAAGAAALAEVEGLRVQLAQRDATIVERDAALAAQRAEQRAELEQQAAADVAAVRAMLEEQHGYALEALRANLEQAHSASVEAVRAEADAHHAADVEAQTEVRVYAALAAEKKSAEAALAAMQATMQAELEAVRAEKADVEAAWAADQQRAAEADAKLGEAQAARVDVENGLRADLNEALKQLAEESDATALERARANRAVADSQSLRQMLESLTMEQARVVGEIEQLRPIAGEVDKARAMIIDMQRQLEAALGTDEDDGDTAKAIAEAVKAQTRDLLELGRAIEPFTWGLERATAFFQDKNIDGATEHLRALGLLQKTLERMKSELERVHSSSSSNGAEAN